MYYEAYQHQLVRDLAWAIASPPLLVPCDTVCNWYDAEWYRQLYARSEGWLRQLDKQPEALQQRVDSQKDRRMGRYFETLWAYWLDQDPHFEVLRQNVALRAGGRTLGELDFLVLDKTTGRHLHWEMAVKFYLGVGDTRVQANWHGPGKNDRLDKKVDHLRHRQSILCRQPDVSPVLTDMGLRIDECGVILKGRLFYRGRNLRLIPYPVDAGQGHDKGEWLSIEQFKEHFADHESFCPLLGKGWMAPSRYHSATEFSFKNKLLADVSAGRYRLPLYLDQHPDNTTSGRFFIVSDSWSEFV